MLRGRVSIGVRLYPFADAEHAHRKSSSQHEQRHRAMITRHDESPLYRSTATIMPLCTVQVAPRNKQVSVTCVLPPASLRSLDRCSASEQMSARYEPPSIGISESPQGAVAIRCARQSP